MPILQIRELRPKELKVTDIHQTPTHPPTCTKISGTAHGFSAFDRESGRLGAREGGGGRRRKVGSLTSAIWVPWGGAEQTWA